MGDLGFKIGIIGGGQLARMLAIEGAKLGFEMHILSESPTDPAAQVVRHWHEGDTRNPKPLQDSFSKVQHVTFESEFLDEAAIQTALLQMVPLPLKRELDKHYQGYLLKCGLQK